jgi:CBS domain containing-hemolysin-like protein
MILPLLITVIILIAGSAFCSSAEASLFSINISQVEVLAKDNKRNGKLLLRLKEDTENSVGAIVILNNFFNIIGTFTAGILANQVFAQNWMIVLFTVILTASIILFGEILPKNFGDRYALQYCLFIAPIIQGLRVVLAPILWIIHQINKIILGKPKENFVSEEEIKVLIDKGFEENSIEHDEKKLIHNVFSLNDKTARDIMTPRVNITSIQADESVESQRDELYASNHSRLIVYGEDHDKVLGYVLLRDLLRELSDNNQTITPGSVVKDLVRVKETTKVDSLLLMFQKKRIPIALVVDEFGGTAGLVTLEDALEELVGEIVDETDRVVDMREIEPEFDNFGK